LRYRGEEAEGGAEEQRMYICAEGKRRAKTLAQVQAAALR